MTRKGLNGGTPNRHPPKGRTPATMSIIARDGGGSCFRPGFRPCSVLAVCLASALASVRAVGLAVGLVVALASVLVMSPTGGGSCCLPCFWHSFECLPTVAALVPPLLLPLFLFVQSPTGGVLAPAFALAPILATSPNGGGPSPALLVRLFSSHIRLNVCNLFHIRLNVYPLPP